ncbi:hypothetical protein LJB76_01420 [Clostridia bacterium OttesenSCG-928-O13]|nr:hypothetical protein [Clostridia bacterium OttesenSCG-928-O13]
MVLPVSSSDAHYSALQTELEKQESFLKVLKNLDAYLDSLKKSEAEKRQEEEERRAEETKQKKIMELKLQIAALRSQVNMGYENAEGELSALENELFLLLLFG